MRRKGFECFRGFEIDVDSVDPSATWEVDFSKAENFNFIIHEISKNEVKEKAYYEFK